MVDSWNRTPATIALTTRSASLIRICTVRQGPWIALALLALTVACQPAEADPPSFFSWSPVSPVTDQTVTFTSNVTGSPQRWALDPDGICNDGEGITVQRSFPLAGNYWVRLCVGDGPETWTDTQLITVLNQPPVAAFRYAPAAPVTGEQIAFVSISSDPDGPIMSQSWDLNGDGTFGDATGPTADWSFSQAGDHVVRLQVTDRDGAVNVTEATIAVGERPAALLTPFPIVRVTAALTARGTRIQELVVSAPPGALVRVHCRGTHCPFRSFARTAKAQGRALRTVRIRRLSAYLLRPGTLIEIKVTKRGEVGKYTSFRIRKGRAPVRVDRCLPAGSRRPAPCPS
jgi:hypothetical protein